MAEVTKTRIKTYQTAPFDSGFQELLAELPGLLPAVRRQWAAEGGDVSMCENGACVCTLCQSGMTTTQKACFQGRSELAVPHLSS